MDRIVAPGTDIAPSLEIRSENAGAGLLNDRLGERDRLSEAVDR
ncbi:MULTISPECIES: hypothetical protein [Mycobacterium]|nr:MULTISPECIES: hypothetical protein [Mycobacterium]MDM4140150.1 hypothetical protein [Mycobacterium sp. FLAC0960]